MGQHKYNPTAIAAKNGELPPKPERPSKRETELALYRAIYASMFNRIKEAARQESEREGLPL